MRELLKLFDNWKHTKRLARTLQERARHGTLKKIRAAFAAKPGNCLWVHPGVRYTSPQNDRSSHDG
jgi:hypothetical protein